MVAAASAMSVKGGGVSSVVVEMRGGDGRRRRRRMVEEARKKKKKKKNGGIGVGDRPWDMMREFDDNIPAQAFDNFQFVNFTEIMSKNVLLSCKETKFALAALMEIPSQYKARIELNILGNQKGDSPQRVPLPPPVYGVHYLSSRSSKPSCSTSFQPSSSPYGDRTSPIGTDPHLCPICLSNSKDMAFGCDHQVKFVTNFPQVIKIFNSEGAKDLPIFSHLNGRCVMNVDKNLDFAQFVGIESKLE
ncbi:hypothetical protein LguiA_033713 [Lonicera macranthoides]